jgi:LysM repeat protein
MEPAPFLLSARGVETTRRRLQNARLGLCGAGVVAALGCADPLVARLLDRTAEPEPAHTREPDEWGRYVVRPGDTLGRIAACRRVSVAALARANELSAPDRLPAGAVLRVPKRNLCGPLPLARKAPLPRHDEARRLLASSTAAYDGADFEQALSLAQAGIQSLESIPRDGEADAIRARCHVLSGMAAAGLEQRERAIVEFRHALDLDPHLALDPERSSPRVLELVEAARESPSRSGHIVESSTR